MLNLKNPNNPGNTNMSFNTMLSRFSLSSLFLLSVPISIVEAQKNWQYSILDTPNNEYELTMEWDHDPDLSYVLTKMDGVKNPGQQDGTIGASNPVYQGKCSPDNTEMAPDGKPFWVPRFYPKSVSAEVTEKTGIHFASVDWQPCGHKDVVICHAESHYDFHLYYVPLEELNKYTCTTTDPTCKVGNFGSKRRRLSTRNNVENNENNFEDNTISTNTDPSRYTSTGALEESSIEEFSADPRSLYTTPNGYDEKNFFRLMQGNIPTKIGGQALDFCVDPTSAMPASGIHYGDKAETLKEWKKPVTIMGSYDCRLTFFEPMFSWQWVGEVLEF